MEVSACKSIVQTALEQRGGFVKHIDNGQLLVKDEGFRIQPDDTYVFTDRVVVIEYEHTKRPVESISKYWWLFEKTDWRSLHLPITCFLFILRQELNEIRLENVLILGRELASKFPGEFAFHCITPASISDDALRTTLREI